MIANLINLNILHWKKIFLTYILSYTHACRKIMINIFKYYYWNEEIYIILCKYLLILCSFI